MLFAQGATPSEILQSLSADHPLITPAYKQPVARSLACAQPVRRYLSAYLWACVHIPSHTRKRRQVVSRTDEILDDIARKAAAAAVPSPLSFFQRTRAWLTRMPWRWNTPGRGTHTPARMHSHFTRGQPRIHTHMRASTHTPGDRLRARLPPSANSAGCFCV